MRAADDALTIAFAEAIHAGDMAALTAMLDATPSLATDRFGDQDSNRSALHILSDWPGNTPNADQVARLLVDRGADVNAAFVGNHTETPLHWAASSDDDRLVNALIDLGANIEASGGVLTGGPPLDDAVVFQQWKSATALVARGAAVSFWHAAALGRDDLVANHVSNSTPTQQDLDNGLWHAAAGGRQTTVDLLIGHGASPAWVGWDHLTASGAAARNGHTSVAENLSRTSG